MQTTELLQKEVPKMVTTDKGKSTRNPLQIRQAGLQFTPGENNIFEKQNPLQAVSSSQNPLQLEKPLLNKKNETGLPNNLKAGVEALSGYSLNDVKVHYNSEKPAQLEALAYTQGTSIHVSPGKERHLAHEAWHVVQQKQGRVSATMQIKGGIAVNDDKRLEDEADRMGNLSLLSTSQNLFAPNREVNGAGSNVAQRFKIVDTSGFEVNQDTSTDARAPFTRFHDTMSITEGGTSGESAIQWNKNLDSKPKLNVADDYSLAINNEKGEPKEFYATQEVINAGNNALQNVNSRIYLHPAGNKITFPTSVNELLMVQPALKDGITPRANEFVALYNSICRDVARDIIGGQISSAILNDGTGSHAVSIGTGDPQVVKGTHHIADTIATGTASLTNVNEILRSKTKEPLPGEEYGKAIRPGGRGVARANALGLNEAAKPRPGQAYVTQSIFNEDKTKAQVNYAVDPETPYPFIWGYHYGSVIAESVDRKDQIVMENYNRDTDIKVAAEQLFADLQNRYINEVNLLIEDVSEDDKIKVGRIAEFFRDRTKVAEIKAANYSEQAGKAYDNMIAKFKSKVGSQWYFRMVGFQSGQTWHEQMAESKYFINPLSMAVANVVSETTRIDFDPGSSSISSQSITVLKNLVKKIDSTLTQSDIIKKIRITGYGSGWKKTGIGGAGMGDKRADSVIAEMTTHGIPTSYFEKIESPGKANASAATNSYVIVQVIM